MVHNHKEEEEWQKRFDKDQVIQDGYRTQQATKATNVELRYDG